MRAAKVQASLRIRAVSPEPSLLAHTSSESRGTYRQKARSLVPMNGWACAVKICHDGMLEDTNSLGGASLMPICGKKLFYISLIPSVCLFVCFWCVLGRAAGGWRGGGVRMWWTQTSRQNTCFASTFLHIISKQCIFCWKTGYILSQYMSRDMTKTTKLLCTQRRLRSAWASLCA